MTKKAMIVDDSRLACKVMAKMLDTLDFSCIEVYSAEDALQQLKRDKPDIIFLDHTMSGMDGLELMKVIKADQLTTHIPVMMYTAKEGDFYVEQAIALGAVDVLPKGLDKKRLLNALKKIDLVSDVSTTVDENLKVKTATNENDIEQSELTDHLQSAEHQNSEQIEEIPSHWHSLWKQRLEPYLEKQRNQQQKAIDYNTKEQTRKLIREMHVTLEQFEHALVLRMESHSDFVAATEKVIRSGRRKWLASLGGLILISQIAIFWHFYESKAFVETQLKTQQLLMEYQNQNQENINQSILALTEAINHFKLKQNRQVKKSAEKNTSFAFLSNEHEEFVANLVDVDGAQKSYQGRSITGYQFTVNPGGELGERLDNIYFLTENCSGESYAFADKATLFRSDNNSLWFIDKLAEVITVNVNSTRTLENECILIKDQIMALYHLQKNQPYETGIDNNQIFKLNYSG